MSKSRISPLYVQPLAGWWVQLAARAQDVDRELLHRLATGSNAERQVICAALASVSGNYSDLLRGLTQSEAACPHRRQRTNEVVEMLRTRSARAVLTEVYRRPLPPGYLGALARTDRPQPPIYYRRLLDVLASGSRSEVRAIMHARTLNLTVLATIRHLPPPIRNADIIAMLPDSKAGEQVAKAVRLLGSVHSAFHDERQLRAMASSAICVRSLVVNAIRRLNAPLPAAPPLAGFRALTTTGELRSIARDWRNCLGEPFMVAATLSGLRSVYMALDRQVLVEIATTRSGSRTLLGIAGPRNAQLPSHVIATIRQRLAVQGIERLDKGVMASEWDVFDELDMQLKKERMPALAKLDFLPMFEEMIGSSPMDVPSI